MWSVECGALPRLSQIWFALRLPTVRRQRILSVICHREAAANASSPCTGEPRTVLRQRGAYLSLSSQRRLALSLPQSFCAASGAKIQLPPQREPRRLPPHGAEFASAGAENRAPFTHSRADKDPLSHGVLIPVRRASSPCKQGEPRRLRRTPRNLPRREPRSALRQLSAWHA